MEHVGGCDDNQLFISNGGGGESKVLPTAFYCRSYTDSR